MKKVILIAMVFLLGSMNTISICAAENDRQQEEISQRFVEVDIEPSSIKQRSIVSGELNTTKSITPSLYECELGIGISPDGLAIEYISCFTVQADEIGCRDIVLQEKTLLGWKDIPISSRCRLNTDVYAGSVVYLDAVKGKTYRVYCTHYALYQGVQYTVYNITGELVFN